MKSSIQLEKVTKAFGRTVVVSEISFAIEKGQIAAFLGPNGAGKSTTMHLLSTLSSPTAGEIWIEGYSLRTEKEQVKRLIGVVFQEDVLDDALTVYENLYDRGSLYVKTRQEVIERMEEVSTILSLQKLMRKRYGTCSGGQRRICQIARALMAKPKLLLLDEPTIGLDPVARDQVWKCLRNLKRQSDMTIFFTTHYMEETVYANRICMINRGKILLCGNKDQIIRDYRKIGLKTIQEIYRKLLSGDRSI